MFAKHWKRLVVQRYTRRYKAAVIVVRKFIVGFMTRLKPKCEENIYVSPSPPPHTPSLYTFLNAILSSPLQFLDFVRVNYIMRLSENLPPRLVGLDEQWPRPPAALHEASEHLKELYRLDKARKFMRRLTPEDRTQVR